MVKVIKKKKKKKIDINILFSYYPICLIFYGKKI